MFAILEEEYFMKKVNKLLAIIPLALMSITMAGTPALTGTVSAAAATSFSDVPADHWAYGAVAKLAQAGIIDGYNDRSFRGDKILTRYEFAIIVAKAMDKFEAADDTNKKLIDTLSAEFNSELNRLGARVAKVENKTNTWVGGETRMRFISNDPNPVSGKRLSGSEQFDFRQRIKFWGRINEDISWIGRITTSGSNKFGTVDYPGSGSEISLDIMNVTFQRLLGSDSIRVGRSALDFYTTGLFGGPLNYDGVTINKRFGDVSFKGWTGILKPATKKVSDEQLSTAQVGLKVNDNLNVKTGYYWANSPGSSTPADIDKPVDGTGRLNTNRGSYDKSQGWSAGFDYKLGKYTLLGDYVGTSLDNAKDGLGSNPKAWAVQFSNSQGPAVLYPAVNLVNPAKAGSDAWLVGYRSIDPGAIPNGAGGYDQTAVSNAAQGYNVSNHGTDNVNVLMLAYQNVIAKNLLLSLEYQDFKIKERGLTSLASDHLDKNYMVKFEFYY